MRYETDADRANERAVAADLEAAWSCRLVPLPPLCPVDYFAERDRALLALVEVKCRARPWADYPVVWLDFYKWALMRAEAHRLHTRPLLVVRCHDVTEWVDLDTVDDVTTTIDGRTDRGDPNDLDLIVCLPKRHFREVPR